MSRVGKKGIQIPSDVSIIIKDLEITVKGKNGVLTKVFSNKLNLNLEENILYINRIENEKKAREVHGLFRALIQNMVIGVHNKFTKILIAEGVGYRFQIDKKNLILNVGYSHPVIFEIPEDLSIKVESNTRIEISGIDKEKVGFFAAQIRDKRPPEPYKGKGILYDGEKIRRKAGKTGK